MTYTELEQIEAAIEAKNIEITDKQSEIDSFELDSSDYEDQYDDMLNDCYNEVFNILPSRILSECDPIAYSCGLNDYVDSMELSDSEEYKTLEEELEELNSELEELEEELEELENNN